MLKLSVSFPLDDVTNFTFGKKNNINNSISVVSKPKPGVKYTKENIKKYYDNTDKRIFKFDEPNCFIIAESKKLIFIPLSNKNGEIVSFAYTNLENYDLVKGKKFHLKNDKKPYVSTSDSISFQEIIYGKKAKRGGWEIITTYIEKKEEDEEYDEGIDDVWLNGEGEPAAKLGNFGDFYLDNISGRMYFKVPKHVLDHANSDSMDNRTENIREISAGANSTNKSKGKNGKLTSKYIGVHQTLSGKWKGKVSYNGKQYKKLFENEYDAAKFRDIYIIRFYKIIMANNGTLTQEEINDIIERGARAIPEKYRLKRKKERELPTYIRKSGNKYFFSIRLPNDKIITGKQRDTLAEAQTDLIPILAQREELIKGYEKVRSQNFEELKKNNTEEKYGYIETWNIYGRYKVNIEIWEYLAQFKWSQTPEKRAFSHIDGKRRDLHATVYVIYNKNYDPEKDGTIDHVDRDQFDCTIEKLRVANFSQQSQNRDISKDTSCIPYQGVYLTADRFSASSTFGGEKFRSGSFFYMEDAAKAYNEHVLSIWEGAKINIVPDTKTSVYDILHRKNLTLEFISNIKTLEEIKSIFSINVDWYDMPDIPSKDQMKKENLEIYKKIVLDLKEKEIREEKDLTLKVWPEDPLHKDNITLEYYDTIYRVGELQKFFKINKELRKMWFERLDIERMTLKTFEECKRIGRILLLKNMEGRPENYKSPIQMPIEKILVRVRNK